MKNRAKILVMALAVCWLADAELVIAAAPPEAAVRPDCTLSGIAVDERGAPVSGAKIRASRDRGGRRVSILSPKARDVIATTSSDAQGRFQLAGLSPGKLGLEVSADGYLEKLVPFLDLTGCTTPVELGKIVLVAGIEVSGQVTDRQGRPLEGVDVSGRAVVPESPSRWTTTSPEGRFSLRGLAPGHPITLGARHDGYFMAEAITVEPPFDAQVTLVLDRISDLPRVVGHTLDPQGHPVAGATILVPQSRIAVGFDGSPRFERSTSESDAEGRFVLQGVTAESFTIAATAEGFQDAEVEVEDHRPGSEVDLTLHPAASVEGTVLDAQGRPVADADISLVVKSQGEHFRSATSGDDGRYHLDGLPPGPQSIELKRFDNGCRTAVRDVVLEPGKNLLDFALEPGSVVTGSVRDEEGRPVAGAEVELHPAGTGGVPALTALTGDEGTFGFQEVPRGPYSVEIHKEDFPFVRLDGRVRVPTAGTEVSGIEIVLPHGGSIAGSVHGLTEAEISRLTLTAIDPAYIVYQVLALLEADGSFQIPGLRPGRWGVLAELDRRSIYDIAVVRSGDETRLDLNFAGHLHLTGQILRNAEPVGDLLLGLVNLETRAGYSTWTAQDGRFRFAGLEPGTYRLSHRQQILRARLGLDDHLDLRVDLDTLETRVSGTIVDASSGRPLSGVGLGLESVESGDERATASSDEHGHFSLSGTLAGSCRLWAAKDGYSPLAARVELQAGKPVTGLDLELAPADRLPLEVRWVDGRAPESVHVIALDAAGRFLAQEWHRLGQDGHFEVRQTPRQGGWLLVKADGAATVRLPILAARGETLPLLLEPEAILDISMPETSVTHNRVTLKDDQGTDYFLGYTGLLSADGLDRIRIDGLPAGTWTVVVESVGGAPVGSKSVTTWAGQTTALHLK